MSQPPRKIDKLVALMRAGDMDAALRMASKFAELGKQREAITRAASALLSPGFYESLGQDPAALVRAGHEALRDRYASHLS